jgi:hypothetical protein
MMATKGKHSFETNVPRANRRVVEGVANDMPVTSYPVEWRIGYDHEEPFVLPQRKQRWGEFFWNSTTRGRKKAE